MAIPLGFYVTIETQAVNPPDVSIFRFFAYRIRTSHSSFHLEMETSGLFGLAPRRDCPVSHPPISSYYEKTYEATAYGLIRLCGSNPILRKSQDDGY